MPEAVVHGLEVIEIDEHHRYFWKAATGPHQRVLDAVGEQCAVRELRHGVVERLVRELLLECLALADVAAVEHDAADVLVVQQVRVLDLERQRCAVAVVDRAFDRVRVVAAAAAVQGDQLLQQWSIVLAEQSVEALSFDVVNGIAEHTFDRWALVCDDAVRIEHGDEIARVRDE